MQANNDRGKLFVYSGKDGSLIHEIDGFGTLDRLGADVSGLGDLDGDGFDDFGATHSADASGSGFDYASVFSGATGTKIRSTPARTGQSIASAGDVNGDGVPDYVTGNDTRQPDGAYHVYSGDTGQSLFADITNNENVNYGFDVSGAGDVNNDGYDDFIIGKAQGTTSNHAADVYSGKDGTLLFEIGLPYSNGQVVRSAGDVNNDGHDDLVVSNTWLDPVVNGVSLNNAGSVSLISGVDGTVLTGINGWLDGQGFGSSIDSLGDINGDGFIEILVGAAAVGYEGNDYTGAIYIYSLGGSQGFGDPGMVPTPGGALALLLLSALWRHRIRR